MKAPIAVLCFALVANWAWAGDPPAQRAMDAYDHAQSLRQQAQERFEAPDPSPAALDAAAALLREALDYLATPEVWELGTGNTFLYARRQDVLREYAGVLALQGHKDEALDALEAMQQEAWYPSTRRWLGDKAFASLTEEPRFKRILAISDVSERLVRLPAINTPFKPELSIEERIAGLTLFWSEARTDFAYFDHVPDLHWDKVYLDFLPKVMNAKTTEDYYRVMMQLAPLLRDGHTNIYPPRDLRGKFYARPPMRTEKIGDGVYVTAVYNESLAHQVKPGDQILAIDGMPVIAYASKNIDPFVSSSTAQDRDVRDYSYQLLSGDAEKAVGLTLRDPAGRERLETVARQGYADNHYPANFQFRKIGEVAYFSVEQFESDAGPKAFEKILPDVMASKALVLDLRHNGGGSTLRAMQILSYLVPDPIPAARERVRGETPISRAGGGAVIWVPPPGEHKLVFERKERFKGPVAVLIGPETFSAAEDFVMMFDASRRGVLVGSVTAGSTGQPLSFALPGGGSARICVKRDTYPDGREFVGKGIAPNIEVVMTADDLRAGKDPVLDRAVAELLKPR